MAAPAGVKPVGCKTLMEGCGLYRWALPVWQREPARKEEHFVVIHYFFSRTTGSFYVCFPDLFFPPVPPSPTAWSCPTCPRIPGSQKLSGQQTPLLSGGPPGPQAPCLTILGPCVSQARATTGGGQGRSLHSPRTLCSCVPGELPEACLPGGHSTPASVP